MLNCRSRHRIYKMYTRSYVKTNMSCVYTYHQHCTHQKKKEKLKRNKKIKSNENINANFSFTETKLAAILENVLSLEYRLHTYDRHIYQGVWKWSGWLNMVRETSHKIMFFCNNNKIVHLYTSNEREKNNFDVFFFFLAKQTRNIQHLIAYHHFHLIGVDALCEHLIHIKVLSLFIFLFLKLQLHTQAISVVWTSKPIQFGLLIRDWLRRCLAFVRHNHKTIVTN